MIPQFEKCGKKVKKLFSAYLVRSFLPTELTFPFSADSLSRSDHCALDENDRHCKQTI